eukprot:1182277-Prorocentrum_minimum.AAC.2
MVCAPLLIYTPRAGLQKTHIPLRHARTNTSGINFTSLHLKRAFTKRPSPPQIAGVHPHRGSCVPPIGRPSSFRALPAPHTAHLPTPCNTCNSRAPTTTA